MSKARPCNIAWIRSIVAQCKAAGVACFVKQLGSHVVAPNDEAAEWFDAVGHLGMDETERYQGAIGRVRGFEDKKGGDWNEWPEDLRVREFPR